MPKKIILAGGHGFIGASLAPFLRLAGNEVMVLSRTPLKGELFWNPAMEEIDVGALEGCDAIINLAGYGLTEERWNQEVMQKIVDSRVQSTRLLVDTIRRLVKRPALFLSASAVGYYGNSFNQVVDETCAVGSGFLATVCRRWEGEAWRVRELGVRLVIARLGLVLSPKGGLLKELIGPFRRGLGAILGNGKQWMSWVSMDDLLALFHFLMDETQLDGAFNICSPNPVTNAEFSRLLSRSLARRNVLSMPAWSLRLLFGKMADEALLSSVRAYPRRALGAGFRFRHPDLKEALQELVAVGVM